MALMEIGATEGGGAGGGGAGNSELSLGPTESEAAQEGLGIQ